MRDNGSEDRGLHMCDELRRIANELRAARLRDGLTPDECHEMAHKVEDVADILQHYVLGRED